MIEFINVSKQFSVDFWDEPFTALDQVSFKVGEGKIVGFLGANGAGKTTSLKCLMGFTPITSGEIHFSPKLGKNSNEIRSQIGYLPERPYFYPHLTGREFVTYMGKLNSVSKRDIHERIGKWSARFRIDFALDRKIKTYSKGMLQRIGFCSVLVHDPSLIILDEPLSGIDPIGRKEIKDVIVDLYNEKKTIFFSSHIVPDVEEICQTVVFLEKGKLVYEGSIDHLILENLKPNYTAKVENSQNIQLPGLLERSMEKFSFYQLENNQKDSFIESCLKNKVNLLSINQNKMTLEEILYKVRHGVEK
jgi:ABC-2 type transport system ATP-binding protein